LTNDDICTSWLSRIKTEKATELGLDATTGVDLADKDPVVFAQNMFHSKPTDFKKIGDTYLTKMIKEALQVK
jgi:hypothetical protein